MKDNLYEIIIAALLHDVGKFKQRAFGGDESKLSISTKNMEGYVLPSGKGGYYSHRHALWTYDFFDKDFIPILKAINNLSSIDMGLVAKLAANHHNASSDTEKIIETADRISAGFDRITDDDSHYKNGDYLKKNLKPVFNIITQNDELNITSKYCYHLNKLSSDNIFPEIINENKNLTSDYKKLWDSFIDELKTVFSTDNKNIFIQNLINLYEKYTWSIPSATNDKYNDISLFDHSITTMNLALSLYLYQESSNKVDNNEFLILTADISGIQSFIFQNQHKSFKGNSKIIRARSFYISLLTEAYYHYICVNLDIPPFVKLINAGGKFISLLPNIKEIKEKIELVVDSADEWLFNNHNGIISIITDYSVSVNSKDFDRELFPEILIKIHNGLEKKKNRKFEKILKSGRNIININFNGAEICDACGVLPGDIKIGNDFYCGYCKKFKDIGAKLVGKKYFSLQKGKSDIENFFDDSLYLEFSNKIEDFNNPLFIYKINSDESLYPEWQLNNYVAIKNNEVLTFEDIGGKALTLNKNEENKYTGSDFLSFIKIDVDNLGNIFTDGFRFKNGNEYINNISISRYVSLSRALNLFFNLVIKEKLKKDYKDFYTVLSGGDDVFIIAPWNKTIDFIEDLNNDFKRFVCNNTDIHFSTGVEVNKHNVPINKSSVIAEHNLDEAKHSGRNKIKFLSSTAYDYTELLNIHREVKWLIEKIKEEDTKYSTGFIYRLLHYIRMATEYKGNEKDNIANLSYISQFRYDVSRNIIIEKDGKIINKEEVDELIRKFDDYSEHKPEIFETIIKIALYETRARIKGDKDGD